MDLELPITTDTMRAVGGNRYQGRGGEEYPFTQLMLDSAVFVEIV